MTAVRRMLGVICYAALAGAVVGGVALARSRVARVGAAVLAADGRTAAEIYRLTRDTLVLEGVFPGRWSVTGDVSGMMEVTVEGGRALAPIYDADQWFQVATLELSAGSGTGSLPTGLLTLGVLALLALVPLAGRWTQPGGGSHSIAAGTASGLVVAMALVASYRWTREQLDAATEARVATATAALRAVGIERVSGRPGGVYQLTGIRHLLLSEDREIVFTGLPVAASEGMALPESPVNGFVTADGVRYRVVDAGTVRLAALPYRHTDGIGAALFVVALVGLGLASLPASLSALAHRPRALRRELAGWSFLGVSGIHLAVFTFAPLVSAGWLSLHRWSLLDRARPFVGLTNYTALLGDGEWWRAVANTALFTLHVPVAMAVALAVALLVHRRTRTTVGLRALFFLPSITSIVAIAIVWQWMLNEEYGVLNRILGLVGVDPIPWLASPATALPAIMLMSVWMVVGYQMVLFLAGLSAIPEELYDAARIDGAGPWNRFLHVTVPGLRHTIFFVFITSVIGSFQVFGAVYVMTDGGPLNSTDVAVFHIYEEAWELFRFGNAAAMSWVLFAIVFFVTWLQFRAVERRAEGT